LKLSNNLGKNLQISQKNLIFATRINNHITIRLMKSLLKQIVSGAMLLALPLILTGCEDILGKWERPTPSIPTPTPTSAFDALSTPMTLEAVEDG
jgi:hypothetical protein